MSELRIILVDDHALLRSGLKAMLAYEVGITVVGEASNGKEGLELYERVRPDIVVMDVTMPVMGGIEASRELLSRHPDAKILVMTQHRERQFMEAVLSVDVSGCIGKHAAGTEFVTALRTVEHGEFYLHPSISRLLVDQHRKKFVDPADTLTPRERQILERIAAGDKNSKIARDLSLSVKTVEWHRSNLMAKLDVHSVADLVRYAVEHGLLLDQDSPIDRI